MMSSTNNKCDEKSTKCEIRLLTQKIHRHQMDLFENLYMDITWLCLCKNQVATFFYLAKGCAYVKGKATFVCNVIHAHQMGFQVRKCHFFLHNENIRYYTFSKHLFSEWFKRSSYISTFIIEKKKVRQKVRQSRSVFVGTVLTGAF